MFRELVIMKEFSIILTDGQNKSVLLGYFKFHIAIKRVHCIA